MPRARDTAAAIGEDLPDQTFTVVDDLRECTPPTRRTQIMVNEKPEHLAARTVLGTTRARLREIFRAATSPACVSRPYWAAMTSYPSTCRVGINVLKDEPSAQMP
ncbi:MAG: hypothetical protein ABI843_17850 [Dokdonella sp.]